jgi:hypothetical protein
MAKTKKKSPSQARVGSHVTLRRSTEKGAPTSATTGAKRKKAGVRTAPSQTTKARG